MWLYTKVKTDGREKGCDLTQSYEKCPCTNTQIQQRDNTKSATKHFDYTTISNWLRTVNKSNESHPSCVDKPFYGIPIVQITAKDVDSKGHTFKN